jgi:hypothetical protein
VPSWLLKAAAQGGLSLLPKSHLWNHLVQKHVTRSLDLHHEWFDVKLMQSRRHIEYYLAARPDRRPPRFVFELGTGWYPVLPLALYVCGASRIWTVDNMPWLRAEAVRATIRLFVEYAGNGRLLHTLPWARRERVTELRRILEAPPLRSASGMLNRLGIWPWTGDARNTSLRASSVDFLVSIAVLEYIPEDVLGGIFAEFGRIASRDAVMSHYISMSDDYALFDRSITPFNFLKYSRSRWRLFSNLLHHQNQLRLSDYQRIHGAAGFSICRQDLVNGSPADLDRVRLADEFRRYPREELLVVKAWVVSVPAVQPRDGAVPDRPAALARSREGVVG